MAVELSVVGDSPGDALRDLYSWLSEEPELRGRVRIVEAPPEPGALGTAPDVLQLALGAGGAFATTATVVIAWLRTRRGELTVKLSRGQEQAEVELTAKGIKDLDAAAVRTMTDHLAQALEQAARPPA
ncbi:hypothetical protein ACIBQ1_08015 [Nonomuraea sp. NPDC050153]|uniref:effector-associated constant component EACC1 n=1 Tax=Nonomuraea sp. NPDC050153 TaxID=3364359 RepID=UPI0037A71081